MRRIGAALALAAMAMTAVPAEAREDRSRREQRRGRGDRIDAGDVALGALVLGGVLAIVGAGRKRGARAAPPGEPIGSAGGEASVVPTLAIEEMTADDAADACAQAAESRGIKLSRVAQVGTIERVERSGEGWLVDGTISLRDGYRDAGGRAGPFHCTLGTRDVPQVRFQGEPEVLASAL